MGKLDLSSIMAKPRRKNEVAEVIENHGNAMTTSAKSPFEMDFASLMKEHIRDDKPSARAPAVAAAPVVVAAPVDDEVTLNKKRALANLYLSEFPEKLARYKSRKVDKMDSDEINGFLDTLKVEASTSSGLNMITANAGHVLRVYEHMMTTYVGWNVTGVSAMADTPEFRDLVKATALKFMSTSLVSVVEPEAKLAFMLIAGSMAANANASSVGGVGAGVEPQKITSGAPVTREAAEAAVAALNAEYGDL